MNIEELRDYCITKKNVSEEFPFDEDTLVMKVSGKMFLLTNLTGNFTINVKCNPEKAIELREQYSQVKPGYHMSKKHWNTVLLDGSIPEEIIKKWIDDSYNLVVSKLPLKIRKEIEIKS